MSGEFPDSAATLFDRRFFLAYWYPTLLSFSAGLLIYSWPQDWKPLDLYFSASQNGTSGSQPSFHLEIILVTLLLTLVFAHLLQAFSHPLVQFWEGYWPKSLWDRYKSAKGVNDGWVKLKKERTNARNNPTLHSLLHEQLFYGYPSQEDQLLPTQLGNILRAAEDYAKSNYGMDVVFWWPRLWLILPETVQQEIEDSQTPMISLLNLATQQIVISSAGFFYLCWQYKGSWGLLAILAAFITLIVGITLTAFAYHGAVSHAKIYGTLIRSVVDTYRFDLIRTLHQPLPSNLDEEKKLWDYLIRWVYLNERESIPSYVHDQSKP
jgi:hypothetical protein